MFCPFQKMNRSDLDKNLAFLSDTLEFIDNFTDAYNLDIKTPSAFNNPNSNHVPDTDTHRLSTSVILEPYDCASIIKGVRRTKQTRLVFFNSNLVSMSKL